MNDLHIEYIQSGREAHNKWGIMLGIFPAPQSIDTQLSKAMCVSDWK